MSEEIRILATTREPHCSINCPQLETDTEGPSRCAMLDVILDSDKLGLIAACEGLKDE